jgi:hypothetical protein
MENKILICTDQCAHSDKYPYGICFEFKDEENKKYFVEYSNIRNINFWYKEHQKYKMSFNVKEELDCLFNNYTRYRITRIKNIQEIN